MSHECRAGLNTTQSKAETQHESSSASSSGSSAVPSTGATQRRQEVKKKFVQEKLQENTELASSPCKQKIAIKGETYFVQYTERKETL